MASGSRKYSREQWRQIIEAQSRSGQTLAVFCDAHGLGKSTFGAWKRRLYGKNGSTTAAVTAPISPQAPDPMFTPLTRPTTMPVSPSSDTDGWTVELDLGGGMCLRLRQGS